MSDKPDNEILKVVGNYRIVKAYTVFNRDKTVYSNLVLEQKRINLAGEAYYSKAFVNPIDTGDFMSEQKARELVSELLNIQNDLLLELTK